MRKHSAIMQDSVVSRSGRQVSAGLADGETVILSLEDGLYYGLNTVGARVWELIRTPRSVSELQNELTEEFAVDPDRCARELGELLGALAEKKLVNLTRGTCGSE